MTREELAKIVNDNIIRAREVAGILKLSAVHNFAASLAEERSMVADLPVPRALRLGWATKAWCGILFVDLRGSTERARLLGPAKTYITMHALLPALAHVVADSSGYIVGFRGDGLFACFGIDDRGENPAEMDKEAKENAVRDAGCCGATMVEAVGDVINPLLNEYDNSGDLVLGLGLDAGEVVFTKIGLHNAHEVTAYGDAVNNASKLASKSKGSVRTSPGIVRLYPTGPNGQVTADITPEGDYLLNFPHFLKRSKQAVR